MTKMEIATYIGMANIMMAGAQSLSETEDTEVLNKIREALCAAQLILTTEAVDEAREEFEQKIEEFSHE